MKKIALFLTGTLIALSSMAQSESKTVPYSTDFSEGEWTIINTVDGSSTWALSSGSSFDGSGYSSGVNYKYDYSNAADDWLISPAIHLEANVEYKIRYCHRAHSSTYTENYAFYMSTGNTPEAMKATEPLFKHEDYGVTTWSKDVDTITPEETGDYYFGFYAYSKKNQYYIYLTGFSVGLNQFTPASVSDFTVTPDANKGLSATLQWTLPTADVDGAAFTDEQSIEKVNIYRDGELVKSFEEAATEWVDTAESGLTNGTHVYEVEVQVAGTVSAKAKVESKYIGSVLALPLPWNPGINSITDDDFALYFTVFNTENSGSLGAYYESSANPAHAVWYMAGSSPRYLYKFPEGRTKDDWVVTPPLKAEEAGIYKLSANVKSASSSYNTNTNVYVGQGTSIDNFTTDNLVTNIQATSASTYSSGAYIGTDYTVYFELTEPQEFNVAFQEYSESTNSYGAYIYSLSVEQWHKSPLHVENIATEIQDESVKLTWTNPTSTNVGVALDNLSKIEIYRNGSAEPVAVITDAEKLVAGAEVEYVDTPGVNGIISYSIVPYVGEYPAEGDAAVVYTKWLGDETQELPYSCDFSNAALHTLWNVENRDGDANEWTLSTSGAALKVPAVTDDTTNDDKPNDLLISAPFDFSAGYYTLKTSYKGGASKSVLKLGLIPADYEEDVAISDAKSITISGGSYTNTESSILKVTEAGKYRLAYQFNDWGDTSAATLTINKVELAYQPILPKAATDCTAVEADNLEKKVTVQWTNPTETNIDGESAVISKIEISRTYLTVSSETEVVAELTEDLVAGATMTWVDENVPSAGTYTYKVVVYGPEGASTDYTTAKTGWVGSGLDLPYETSDFTKWTVYNVNNDTNNWGDEITWENYTYRTSITSSSKEPDDWNISLPFTAIKDYIYKVSVDSWGYYSTPCPFDIYVGTSQEYSSMLYKIGTASSTGQREADAETSSFYMKAVDMAEAVDDDVEVVGGELGAEDTVNIPAGVFTIGFYANQKGSVYVKNFKIEVAQAASDGVENLSAKDAMTVIDGIALPANATNIIVSDLSGHIVAKAARADKLSTKDLAKGFYIISAKADGKRISMKLKK